MPDKSERTGGAFDTGVQDAGPFRTYEEARDWITGLTAFGIRPGLERITRLLERFDRPERRLKFIHVAGTNGKGSVCAYLTSVLRAAGYDVGTFTSPYLTRFTDRITFNGRDIPDEVLVRLANEVKPHVDELAETELGSPTMFEVTTMIAILYFAKVAYPDYVVWEAGLGGRLDVTNVVVPVVSVITNIGHDHLDVLGDTLEAIAAEKAGIIKAGVPVVSAASQPEAIRILAETAAARKSTLYLLGRQFREMPLEAGEGTQRFRFEGPFRAIEPLEIAMLGAHQRTNAAVAVMTLEVLRQYYALILEEGVLEEGLRAARWPGRLELVREEPRILLDGAHNPEGMAALAAALKESFRWRRLHLMIGALANKNHIDMLRHILPIADSLIVTEPDFKKKLDAGELARIAAGIPGCPADAAAEPDWRRALDMLIGRTGPEDLAVVSGSLYLIADVRSSLLHDRDIEKGW
ncbi:MAG: bifunctional folylpolyglutamate synthase/dihydrofolate synthase [Paenibacillaceae bacterium]|jgi:dihydrofolate synthase/folylpolyglutamate synthase|nr:MAG: bifunctional folylpolyglutamate synthase/dihydrofolate synthase [Paenibacillaceae bacterium]